MPTGGALCLDNRPNYENPVNAGTTWSAIDAPAEVLTSSYKSAAITGKFQMYYMYQPKSPSIWVTLSEVMWNWSASAARIGDPNTWCLGGAVGCPDKDQAVNAGLVRFSIGGSTDLEQHGISEWTDIGKAIRRTL